MSFRLKNQDDPRITFGLTTRTWYGILEMAEEHGWNPMGTVLQRREFESVGPYGAGFEYLDEWRGEYWTDGDRLVMFEDALNMADALERAFLSYEPQYIPSLYFYSKFGDNFYSNGALPSLGAIQGVIDLCQRGGFQIEKF